MAGKLDYQAVLSDPAAHFTDPAAVLDTAGWTTEQKIAVLRQWEYDGSDRDLAAEEGMPGPESVLMQKIAAALVTLDPNGGPVAPNKQRVPPSH
jgi:hypothetical protein